MLHHNFGKVHQFGIGSVQSCPCTALSSRGDEIIASVGEDGCLVILALETARSGYDTTFRIGVSYHAHVLHSILQSH